MKNNYLQETAITLSPDNDDPTIGTDDPTTGGGTGGQGGDDGKM